MSETPAMKGVTFALGYATQQVICTVERVIYKINLSTQKIETGHNKLSLHETGNVMFRLYQPIIVKKASDGEKAGRIFFQTNNKIGGVGRILIISVSRFQFNP